jgi:hypothetical protein
MNATIKLSLHVLFLVAVAIYGRKTANLNSSPQLLKAINKNIGIKTDFIRHLLDESIDGMRKFVDRKTNFIPIFDYAQATVCSLDIISVLVDSCKKELELSDDKILLSGGAIENKLRQIAARWRAGQQKNLIELSKKQIPGVSIYPEKLNFFLAILDCEYVIFEGESKANALLMLEALNMRINTEAVNIVWFLGDQMGNLDLYFPGPIIKSRPIKMAYMRGEEYIAELVFVENWLWEGEILAAWVNDSLIFEKDKKEFWHTYRAHFKLSGDKIGQNNYTAKILFKNPHTMQADTCSQVFCYQVVQPTQISTLAVPTAPVPILAELRGGDITREKLIFPITLQSEDERQTVLSFTLWHLQKGEEPKPYKIKSDKIPAYILEKIQAGDQLQFVDIRGREKRDLPTMAFIVNN